MESDIVVEGFQKSEEIHQLRYLHSMFAKLKEKVSYGNIIKKIECKNHVIKNYTSALYKVCKRRITTPCHNNVKDILDKKNICIKDMLYGQQYENVAKTLRTLVDNLSKHLRTLNKLSVNTENWDVTLIFLLSSKLDKFLHRKWEEKTNSRELPNLQDFKSFLCAQADLLESLGSDRPDEQPEANGTRKALVIASSPGHGTSPKPSPKPKAHAVPAATAASTGLLAKMVSRLHRDPTTTYQVAELEGPSSLRGHDGGGEG
ncbi:unnamed protein product [Parnassius apollo]|uniref:(apollo) hypothetical protein n=1 Tax=Parnassius apollo TaxID=110799 RepID=A0A8S3X3N4_PARAO|nr:unnamed protein product [Parnassius apollo]